MKKLFLVLSLVPLTSFGQVIIGQPKFGDNPLAQEVPLKENRVVDMSFIDTLLYKVKDSTILNDSFITDINSRYDSVLNELYGIEILNCEIFQNQLLIHVDVTDKIYYTPAVFRYRIPGISIGTIFLDLYNIETSFQNGTLLNDIGEIFEILNKQ
jgi:hypothetical protein